MNETDGWRDWTLLFLNFVLVAVLAVAAYRSAGLRPLLTCAAAALFVSFIIWRESQR